MAGKLFASIIGISGRKYHIYSLIKKIAFHLVKKARA